MDHEKQKAFIHKLLNAGSFIAAITPNPVDNIVLSLLQLMAKNEDLMDLLLGLFDKIHQVQETRRRDKVYGELDIKEVVLNHFKSTV